MVYSLLTTLLNVPNVGHPSSWPGQLGHIIWTVLAVQRQQKNSNMHETSAYTRDDTVLVSLLCFVCFIFCGPISWCSSTLCCIVLKLEDKGNTHMNSLYGKMGLHMVHIMWSEWSDWSQMHFECIQTYGFSFGSHQTMRMWNTHWGNSIRDIRYDNNQTHVIFWSGGSHKYVANDTWILKESYESLKQHC